MGKKTITKTKKFKISEYVLELGCKTIMFCACVIAAAILLSGNAPFGAGWLLFFAALIVFSV